MSDPSTQDLIHWLTLQIEVYQGQLSEKPQNVVLRARPILEMWTHIRARLQSRSPLPPDTSTPSIAEIYRTLRETRETMIALGLPGDPTVPVPDED